MHDSKRRCQVFNISSRLVINIFLSIINIHKYNTLVRKKIKYKECKMRKGGEGKRKKECCTIDFNE